MKIKEMTLDLESKVEVELTLSELLIIREVISSMNRELLKKNLSEDSGYVYGLPDVYRKKVYDDIFKYGKANDISDSISNYALDKGIIINLEEDENLIPLDSIKGKIIDVSYGTSEDDVLFHSVARFINHIANIEIDLVISEYPDSYEDNSLYQKYIKILDSQKILQKDLDEMLDRYGYEIIQ